MSEALPVVYPGNAFQVLPPGVALNGTAGDYVLAYRAGGAAALTLTSTDQLLDGVPYLWEKSLLPAGRGVYLEVVASGALSVGGILTVTVSLVTAAGAVVADSVLAIGALTAKRVRSLKPLTLDDNTEYLLRYKTSAVAGTAYLNAARLLIR